MANFVYVLNKARQLKNDEFYTLPETVKEVVTPFLSKLENKIIYLNCDNPEYSEFWKYLHQNFSAFKLKKIIATFYEPQDLFFPNPKKPYKLAYTGGDDNNILAGEKTYLLGDGSFTSSECIKILNNECDILITNPPFSKLSEFWPLLKSSHKDFILVTATTFLFSRGTRIKDTADQEIYIKVLKNNKFLQPNGQLAAINTNILSSFYLPKRPLLLNKSYIEAGYQKFDNYDAINVDKISDIPADYYQQMGVPATILFYDLSDFNVVGYLKTTLDTGAGINNKGMPIVNGKIKYTRVLIQRKTNDEATNDNSIDDGS